MKKLSLFMVAIVFLSGSFCFCAEAFSGEVTVRVPEEKDYPPFFIRDQNGKWGGLSIELAEALLREAGHTPVYVPLPFMRGLEYLKNGKIDMMLNMTVTEEREAFTYFIGPQLDETVFLVTRKGSDFPITSLDDLKKLPNPIGTERGKVYGKSFEEKRAADKELRDRLEEVTDVGSNERKLNAGRISGFLGYGYNVSYQIRTNPLYQDFGIHPFVISQDWVYYGFSKKNVSKEQLKTFQDAYDRASKKGGFEAIRKRYLISTLKKEGGFPSSGLTPVSQAPASRTSDDRRELETPFPSRRLGTSGVCGTAFRVTW